MSKWHEPDHRSFHRIVCYRVTSVQYPVFACVRCVMRARTSLKPKTFIYWSAHQIASTNLIFISLQVLPALRSFCLYCAFGVLIVYILQSVLFTAFLALDIKRVRENRNGFLFCITHKMEEGTEANTGKSLSEALLFAEHVAYKNCSKCQKQFL